MLFGFIALAWTVLSFALVLSVKANRKIWRELCQKALSPEGFGILFWTTIMTAVLGWPACCFTLEVTAEFKVRRAPPPE